MQNNAIRVRVPGLRLSLAAAAVFVLSMVMWGNGATAFASTPVVAGGKAVVTNTDGDPIRIRRGAGTEFGQVGVAYEGQTVGVLDGPKNDKTGKPWFKVQAPGGTGWMMAEFLEGVAGTSTGPVLKGSAQVANTNGDPLRMRAAPSASAEVIALLQPGETVAIVTGPMTDDTAIVWYMIKARGLTGWAMAQYLAQAPEATQATAPAAPTAATAEAQKASTQAKPAVEAQPAATQKPAAKATAAPAAQSKGSATSTMGQYRQWMEEARVMYPYKQTVDKMWSVMMCESGGNARASGGGGRYLGLFQYAPATWGGSWNPYRGNSIWDPKSQIFATAKAWSIGMQSHWSCYYITPGR